MIPDNPGTEISADSSRNCSSFGMLPLSSATNHEHQHYYQVMCDSRDTTAYERASLATQTWARRSTGVFSGLDYVSHNDMLPFNPSTGSVSGFQHHFLDVLFERDNVQGPIPMYHRW